VGWGCWLDDNKSVQKPALISSQVFFGGGGGAFSPVWSNCRQKEGLWIKKCIRDVWLVTDDVSQSSVTDGRRITVDWTLLTVNTRCCCQSHYKLTSTLWQLYQLVCQSAVLLWWWLYVCNIWFSDNYVIVLHSLTQICIPWLLCGFWNCCYLNLSVYILCYCK